METSKVPNKPVRGALKRWFSPLITAKPWLQTIHLLMDLPIGIATFTFAVTFLSMSGGLVVTLIGIPLLAATILAGRLIAGLERQRSLIFLGEEYPKPSQFNFKDPSLKTLWAALRDVQGWKGLLYAVVALPLGIFNFTFAVTIWTIALSFTFSLLALPFVPHNGMQMIHFQASNHHWNHIPWHNLSGWSQFGISVGLTLLGVFLLGLTTRVIALLTKVKQAVVATLCGPSKQEKLHQRVSALEESRSASVTGAANDLRRIERDLHDGAQQHLVSVAMQLGIAKEKLADGSNPEVAEIIDVAHKDAKDAIAELRNLVRGIHPTVLTDRGLDAAISALAARSPIPVQVSYELTERQSMTVEATAYFVVAEALTNVAKHSNASSAQVRVYSKEAAIVIEVSDDGRGGAVEGSIGGLRGLHDRVRSVEGKMELSSPDGGPTKVVVELPCE